MPDGRRLAYTEWGIPDGTPVLCFHGTPGTRLWCPDEEATTAAGVRLIMPDRPGIGRSDPLPGRTLADWPNDVQALADALEISNFGVVGISGGGVYTAACAALIPARLLGVAIFSCRALSQYNWAERPDAVAELSPEERAEFDLAQVDPAAAANLTAEHAAAWVDQLDEHPEIVQEMLENEGADGDRWFWEDPSRKAALESTVHEWARQGLDGVKWEMIDVFQPWGFRLADISIPVSIWCGGQDPRVRHMEFQSKAIRNSSLTIWPDSGHLGVAKHWNEILEAVAP
jgi:pimeloyl-ACP methyl ester carboxylesterase